MSTVHADRHAADRFTALPDDETLAATVLALEEHGFSTEVVDSLDAARDAALARIPHGSSVMTNTSVTLQETGIADAINDGGPYDSARNAMFALDFATQAQEMKAIGGQPDYALGSVHAITRDGTLVIASASGSQLASYAWGAANVIFVVGAQKLVPSPDAARERIYQHSLVLEDARAQAAYGQHSSVGKILEIHQELPGRIHIVLVRQPVGFRRAMPAQRQPRTLLPRIAVLGAGHSGPVLARVAMDAGYPVTIAASGDPADIELITQVLVPGAEPRWAADAAADADIVVLAIPLHKFATLDPSLVAGKLVVDVMNYWPVVDGVVPMFDDHRLGSSEIVQRRLPSSTVVKALNHIGYHELDDERRPAGAPDRRALGVAADDPRGLEVIASLVDRIGYDPIRLDSLGAGRILEPGGPVFGFCGAPSSTKPRGLTLPSATQPVPSRPDTKGNLHVTPLILGLDTFGDAMHDERDRPLSHAATIRNVVEQGVLAEQAGVDFFGIGEHHTSDFPMPAADVVLAAIAARTTRMHLGSAVTVLSSDDPVRVFQRYSTLNAISGGRAEVILGRGSSIDSFPLFGYDLADYEDLFEEKAGLFAELLHGGPVTWEGKTRAPLYRQDVVPHTESGPFPAWIGVGGSPQSVIRAARYGYSLMLAIIGGSPARFAPFSRLYQQALEQFGRSPLPVGVHAPGHVAATDEQAREEFWPRYRDVIASVGAARGFAVPTPDTFQREVGPAGALYVGSPETVAQKIAANLTVLGANRFDLKYGMGGLSHPTLMTAIELYGTQVIPRVRELLASQPHSKIIYLVFDFQ